jgi:hypothetical protein
MFWASLMLLAQTTLSPDTRQIDQFIEQLGSDLFVEREAALKALDQMGYVALERLRIASRNSHEPEIRRSAARLIRVVSARVTQAQALAIRKSALSAEEKGQKLRQFVKKGMTHTEAEGLLGKDCFSVGEGKFLIVHYRECDLWITYYEYALLVVGD